MSDQHNTNNNPRIHIEIMNVAIAFGSNSSLWRAKYSKYYLMMNIRDFDGVTIVER